MTIKQMIPAGNLRVYEHIVKKIEPRIDRMAKPKQMRLIVPFPAGSARYTNAS